MMAEADERFAARLAEELARHVGPGVVVLGLDVERHPNNVTLVAHCAAGGEQFAAQARGETELEAWTRLPSAVSEERLRRAFVRIVDQ
jgi:hypothetical protein